MRILSAGFPPGPRVKVIDRQAGWILSICLHVMLFSILVIINDKASLVRVAAPPLQMRVRLLDSKPVIPVDVAAAPVQAFAIPIAKPLEPPTAVLLTEEAPLVSSVPAQQTDPDPAPEPQPPEAGPTPGGLGRLEGAFAPAQAADALPRGVPLDKGAATGPSIAAVRGGGGHGGQMGQSSAVAGGRGSKAVAGRIGQAMVVLKAQSSLYGKKDLFSARGAAEGVTRELDISGVSQSEAQKVLDRYGIKILMTRVNSPGSDMVFLNKAKTNEGQFVSGFGAGIYRVFRYPASAVGRMMQLEEDALHDNGFDPARSRVVRVIFGVVSTPQGYELGVKKIEAQPVMEPKPADKEEAR